MPAEKKYTGSAKNKSFRHAACVLTAVFVFMSLAAASASVTFASSDSLPYDVILSVTGDASSSMTVTWHDSSYINNASVVYSQKESMAGAASAKAERVSIKSGIPLSDTIWTAELTSLSPDTVYYYYIDNGKTKTDIKSFTTASAGSEAGTSFIYMGDIQVSRDAETEYDSWGSFIDGIYKKNPDISFGLLGGDIVESGVSEKQFGYFLKNATSVFSSIPLFSTNGNHESNFPDSGKPELYLDMFLLPQNGPDGFKEEFYSFDYNDCHITVLNSWVFSGEQKLGSSDLSRINAWIDNDLKSSSARFSIVVMHHPAYALANDNVAADVYESWRPLFEADGVDLVLCGHQHVYARSYPLTAGRIDNENGVTYVMGMSGKKFYTSADETKQERVIYSVSNCQIIRTDGNQLTLTTLDESGNELDYWTTTAREKPGRGASGDTADAGTVDGLKNPSAAKTLSLAALLMSVFAQ